MSAFFYCKRSDGSVSGRRYPKNDAHGTVCLSRAWAEEKQVAPRGEGVASAIVVTYHPEPGVVDNLRALRLQTDRLIVVDNGSSPAELQPLRELLRDDANARLIEHGENLGIATALNRGVREAIVGGATWILLFDQDSCVTDGFVPVMIRGFGSSAWGDRVGIMVPRYRDSRLGTLLPGNRVASGGLEAAMTSGSLLRSETFLKTGLFADELFIDGVDYEYSLRLRESGYLIEECADAVLLHSPGEPRVIYFRGRRLYQTANYSPIRRYYQERNKIWIAKRYFRRFPVFCGKLFWFSSKDFIKILVAEKNSWEKATSFCRGVRDGLLRSMRRSCTR